MQCEPRDLEGASGDNVDVARVEAFSDGVFSFAVALLVLAIRIPRLKTPTHRPALKHLLLDQWPSYVAFALSFTVVGTIWANHRLAFSHLPVMSVEA